MSDEKDEISDDVSCLTSDIIMYDLGRSKSISSIGECTGTGYGSFSIVKVDLTVNGKHITNLNDVSILKKFHQLQILKLPNNKIENVNFIESLPLLHTLDISKNNLTEALDYASPICAIEEKGTSYIE